jgi:uncharacterized protein YndB with AHSA1/START domain
VPLSPADAFLLFTERMTDWWPLPTHSLGQALAERVDFEPWTGGRIVEHTSDGEEHVWGEVLIAEPPHRIVFTWHPGLDADTEVEVTFRSSGDQTEVVLEHRKWENLGAMADEARTGYANGWPFVFVDRFTAAAKGEFA